MYSPGGRTGRTPGGVMPIVAAVAVALMGTGGVALAAPKADPGPPEQAQGNGPPPQAQVNGPPPQAQYPAPAPEVKAKAKGQRRAGGLADVPLDLPPPAGGDTQTESGAGQSRQGGARGDAGHHGRPTTGESHGQGPTRSSGPNSSVCHSDGCRGGTPSASSDGNGGGNEQSKGTGGQPGTVEGEVLGVSEERPDDNRAGAAPGEGQVGAVPELGSVLGANQGGGEEVDAGGGGFDAALPFTGFGLLLLAGIGALLGLAGVWLRRLTT